ncbi:MAG TPA: hypothetical protein PLW02_09030 [Verrucomicrobiota bacterium]|nr:hypothetical protein [Verrucomicrobiota bacterium]
MNTDLLIKKLLSAAKYHKSSDAVPYAFEKRIMAQIAGLQVYDATVVWAKVLWRAVKPCLFIMAAACLWAILSQNQVTIDNPSEAFKTAVLAGLNEIGSN